MIKLRPLFYATAKRRWRKERIAKPEYNVNGNAGCASCKLSPATSTRVSVFHTKQAGLDASKPWVSVCEDHGSIVEHATKKLADAARDPREWCDACREAMPHGGNLCNTCSGKPPNERTMWTCDACERACCEHAPPTVFHDSKQKRCPRCAHAWLLAVKATTKLVLFNARQRDGK